VVLGISLHKGFAKRVLRDAGIPTADFAMIELPEQAVEVDLPVPLFVKPVAEGTGKGIDPASCVRDREKLAPLCRDLLARFRQPLLVERFLPGRELTVGVWGTGSDAEALGALEIVLRPGAEDEAYSYVNKEECEDRVEYRLAQDAEAEEACALAVAAWRTLGCCDAGRVDLRADERGRQHVLEINPLAGLHPEHSDLPILCSRLGIRYERLIDHIVRSAAGRAGLNGSPNAKR